MELATIKNVKPKGTALEMISEGVISSSYNVFDLGFDLSADISVTFGNKSIAIPGIRFFYFSRDLMQLVFDMSFDQVERLQIETLNPTNILLTATTDGDKIGLRFDIGSASELFLDGARFQRGEAASFEVAVLEFTRACSSLFKASLETLDEVFEGIDGVAEFFGNIYFARMFLESWELDQ